MRPPENPPTVGLDSNIIFELLGQRLPHCSSPVRSKAPASEEHSRAHSDVDACYCLGMGLRQFFWPLSKYPIERARGGGGGTEQRPNPVAGGLSSGGGGGGVGGTGLPGQTASGAHSARGTVFGGYIAQLWATKCDPRTEREGVSCPGAEAAAPRVGPPQSTPPPANHHCGVRHPRRGLCGTGVPATRCPRGRSLTQEKMDQPQVSWAVVDGGLTVTDGSWTVTGGSRRKRFWGHPLNFR